MLCQNAMQAYSPLGSPGTFKEGNVLQHPVVVSTAEKLGKTPAQVALRWGIQTGYGVLPKSTNEERIRANLDVYDWSVPSDLLASFSEIEQVKLVRGEFWTHPEGVFKSVQEFWDGEIGTDLAGKSDGIVPWLARAVRQNAARATE